MNYELKYSPKARHFFANEKIPRLTRAKLVKKCKALKQNPFPEGHESYPIEGQNIYRLPVLEFRIMYKIENYLIEIIAICE